MKKAKDEKLELMRRQTLALEKMANNSNIVNFNAPVRISEGNFTRVYDGYGNSTLVDEWGTPRRYQD